MRKSGSQTGRTEGMDRGWIVYMILMLGFNLLIWSGPYLAMSGSGWAEPFYEAMHFTCHQLDSRSLCIYPHEGPLAIGNCLEPDEGGAYERLVRVPSERGLGYKLPVCARDVAIYGGMLLGGLVWLAWASRKSERKSDWPHPIWLVIAITPLAIDGLTQLVGWRESTNEMRIATGLLAGIAMAFYALPSLHILLEGGEGGAGRGSGRRAGHPDQGKAQADRGMGEQARSSTNEAPVARRQAE